MTQSSQTQSEQYEPDGLVVETPHLRLVMNSVGERLAVKIDDDPQLGLTLVKLIDVRAAADRVRAELSDAQVPTRGQDWSDLDWLLANLRAVYEKDYAWTPRLGKNRTMTGIQFVTYPNAEKPPGYFQSVNGPHPATASEIETFTTSTDQPERREGVRIGLPDTRFYPHRLLAGRYIADRATLLPTANEKLPYYLDGHAAFVGSIILRQAPAAELDVRAIDQRPDKDDELGGWSSSIWEVARKIVQYASSGVQVINCSFACYTRDGEPPLALERAIAELTPNIVVVAGAGNHGQNTRTGQLPTPYAPAFPAALTGVIAVGALKPNGDPAKFNPTVNRPDGPDGGRELAPWIDLLAPGDDVVGAYLGDIQDQTVSVPELTDEVPTPIESGRTKYVSKTFSGYAKWSGTSFSAAYVTGAIAGRVPKMTAQEALDELRKGVDPNVKLAHQ